MNGPVVPSIGSSTDDYRHIVATNLDGASWTLREGAKAMADPSHGGSAGGSIITISSVAAIRGSGRNQPYPATKAGLLAMSNGAAVELARHGIRVNTVLTG
jgi:NAD(P)-dependent dehydrogenase (short-subunit alcohol dehydrogenase family)